MSGFLLYFFHQLLENSWVFAGKLGEDFSIEFNIILLQAVNEF